MNIEVFKDKSESTKQYVSKLYNSFFFFMYECWTHLDYHDYHPLDWVEREMCDWCQNGPQKSINLAWRGFGKTTLLSQGLACWDLFRDANEKIVIVSKSEEFAKKIVFDIKNWIVTIPFLNHLKTRPNTGWQRDKVLHFDVGPSKRSRHPSVVAFGIEGQLEGSRASHLIGDDIETEKNVESREMRVKLLDRASGEFTSVCRFGRRKVSLMGTFHHEESTYIALTNRGYQARTWPLLYPTEDEMVMGLSPIAKNNMLEGKAKPGDVLAPYRISVDEVIEAKATGSQYFNKQYMLLSNLSSKTYPLMLEDFIVFPCDRYKAPISIAWGKHSQWGNTTAVKDITVDAFGSDNLYGPVMFDEKWAPYQGVKMWIDPAGRGNDKTGYAIVAHLHGNLFVLACDGIEGSGYESKSLHALATEARNYGVQEIYVEDVAGWGMMAELLEPICRSYSVRPGESDEFPNGWATSIVKMPVSGQKERRIIGAIQGPMQSHRLVVSPNVIKNTSLQYQVTRITSERNCLSHEDELESLAMCVKQWQDCISLDPNVQKERYEQDLFQKQLHEHYLSFGPTEAPNWKNRNPSVINRPTYL